MNNNHLTEYFIILLLSFSFHFNTIFAQTNCDFFNDYCKGDLQSCKNHLDACENNYIETPTIDYLYFLAKSRYLYTAFLLEKEKFDDVKAMLPKLESASTELEKNAKYTSYAQSLKAAMYAMTARIDMSKLISAGMQCSKLAEQALATDSDNPYANTEFGHIKFHAPYIFGGDCAEASEYYKKAVESFEKNPKDLTCNWYYINTLLFLAKSYEETDQPKQAIAVYDKIIKLAPLFGRAVKWRAKLIEQ